MNAKQCMLLPSHVHGICCHLIAEPILLKGLHHSRTLLAQGCHDAFDAHSLAACQAVRGLHSTQAQQSNHKGAQHACATYACTDRPAQGVGACLHAACLSHAAKAQSASKVQATGPSRQSLSLYCAAA